MADGQVIIDSKLNVDGVEKGSRDIKSELQDLAKTTGKTAEQIESSVDDANESLNDLFEANVAADLLVDALKSVASAAVDLAKESIQAAADIKASNAQFEQTFKGMEKTARKSLDNISKQTGIAATRMQDSFTKIFAFSKTVGADQAEALDISTRAMEAAADVAAYYDISIEDATETLQSFLKGNYENDAALGIAATETTRNAKANEMYAKSFIELSESQKVDVLLAMVEAGNQASGALGQAAREADSWTNVTGELQKAWRQFLAVVGTPILENLTPAIQRLTEWLQKLSETAASEEIRDGLQRLRDDFTDMQNELVSTGDQYSDTAIKAEFYAKKLEELEAAGLNTAEAQAQYRAAAQALQELLPNVSIEIDEQTGLINMSRDAILAEVEALKQKAMFAATEELFTEALKKQAEAALLVSEAELALVETQATEATLMADIQAKTGMTADEYIRLAGNLDVVNQSFTATDIPGMSAMMGDLGQTIAGVTQEEQALIDALIKNRTEQEALQQQIASGKEEVAEYGNQFDVLSQTLQNWQTQHGASVAATSQATIEATEEVSNAVVETNKEAVSQIATDTTNVGNEIVNTMADTAGSIETTAAAPLEESLTGAADAAGEAFENAADTAKTSWSGIGTWFDSNVTSPVKTSIESMGKSWAKMESDTATAWANMVKTVEDAVTKMQNKINSLTGKTIDVTVNKTGSGANLVSYSGYDGQAYSPAAYTVTPQIPYLATGAVIPPRAPFMAVLGDQTNGRNLEAPEDLIRKIVREESGGGIEVVNTVNFEGDLAQLGRVLKPVIDSEAMRKGKSLATDFSTE